MDAQIETTIYLELFPTEIWSCMSRFLPGEQIFRLMFTGSKTLWRKLSAPYTVQAIILGNDYLQLKRWPAIIKELPNLEALVVNFKNYWNTFFGDFKLYMLPRTLKKLQLSNCGYFRTEKDIFTNVDGSRLQLGEHFPALEELDLRDNSLLEQVVWPLNLTSLTTGRWCFDILLPSSVIKIVTEELRLQQGQPIHIPPRLQSLVIDRHPPDSLVAKLPPSLTSLTISKPTLISNRPTANGGCPQILLLRNLKSAFLGKLSLPTDPAKLFTEPSSLAELVLQDLPASFWPFLPSTLRSLDLGGLSFTHNTLEYQSSKYCKDKALRSIRTIPIGQLPKSLTHLTLAFHLHQEVFVDTYSSSTHDRQHFSEEELSFPPALTSLKLVRAQLSKDAAGRLPSSLKILDIEQLDPSVCENLPRGITSLFAWNAVIDNNFCTVLPSSLTELEMTKAELCDTWYHPLTGAKTNLRALKDIYPTKSILSLLGLPPGLRLLSLANFHKIDPNPSISWPENLQTLNLQDVDNWTDLCLPSLPRHLLHLNISKSAEITGRVLKNLPRGLLSLNINASSQIHDSDIPHLPRTLQRLNLDSAMHLTDVSAKDFPRDLHVLTLCKNRTITPDALKDFPFKLKSVQSVDSFYTATWEIYHGSKNVSNPIRPLKFF